MAIKGKRKSKGGQARRPTPAPRAPVSSRGRTAWYQTSGGRVFIASMIVLIIVGIVAGIAVVASEEDTGPRREALTRYTDQLRDLSESLGSVAVEMQQSISLEPEDEGFAQLDETSRGWLGRITDFQAQAAQISPPGGLTVANNLVFQSINLYNSAARTFGLVPEAEGRLAQEVLDRATETFSAAEALFGSAVGFLDEERAALELGPARVSPPSIAAAASQPQPGPSTEVTTGPSPSPDASESPEASESPGEDESGNNGRGKGENDGKSGNG